MKRVNARYITCFCALALLLMISMAANIIAGTVDISMGDIFSVLTGKTSDGVNSVNTNIILSIRLPRMIGAAILGGALSVSGYLLQTFFANPIAGPFVLGISSGAKLTVALAMIIFLERGMAVSSLTLIAASFAGSMISMVIILGLSGRMRKSSMLIVCGVMIGYICSAVTDLFVTFADESNIVNLHNWSLGSFSGISMRDVRSIAAVTFAALAASFFLSKQINAYRLGEAYAENMGVNIRLFRFLLILLSGLLSAAVTAFAGPVSFVGIAVPHLVKSLFKTSDARIIIPAAFMGGAVFCLFCDLLARMLFAPSELSISTVTSFFGAPVVIMIMLRRRKGE